jgi:hypothetical protein
MKIIYCANGEEVLVDDEDYPILARHSWQFTGQPHHRYVCTTLNNVEKGKRTIYMHTMIMGYALYVDHRDNDPLNNQKYNLRKCGRNQNEWNKGKFKTVKGKPPTSKYKGVSLQGKKYNARIMRNGVLYDLGYFNTPEEGAAAYNKKDKELSGEFAWENSQQKINQQN